MHLLPTPGTLVSDKYRIEALLGEGSMGAVFRAHHELLNKHVALKWLRPELSQQPEARDRFLREARAASRIHHQNVVEIYDMGVHEDGLFLVMELLSGETFEETIERTDVHLATGLRLLIGAMQGVAAAHRRGIVHRDIKPENIFVVRDETHPDGIAKVLDFSISKLLDDHPSATTVTQTGYAMGTPLYMSLEQMNGVRDVDHRTDIYAFGVLLYRILTGELPFEGPSLAAIAIKLATHHPLSPNQVRPELPASLDLIVMKAIARERELRYQTMDALVEDLTSVCVQERLLPSSTIQRDPIDTLPSPMAMAATLDRLRMMRGSAHPSAPRASLRLSKPTRMRVLLPLVALTTIAVGGFMAWESRPRAVPHPMGARNAPAPRALPTAATTPPPAPQTTAPVAPAPIHTNAAARRPQAALPATDGGLRVVSRQPARARVTTSMDASPATSTAPSAAVTAPLPEAPQPTPEKSPRTATGKRSGTLSLDDLTD
jgi:eukaryotic-like serine/threonine-protein kinase